MNSLRRRLAVAVAICAIIGFVSGVGGYNTTSMDRMDNSDIVTVEDPTEAYISFDDKLECGDNDIIITNNFADETTLNEGEVTVTAEGGKLRFGPNGNKVLNNGDSETFPENGFSSDPLGSEDSVTIRVDSKNTTATSVTVGVDASGSAVAVDTTATVDVDC